MPIGASLYTPPAITWKGPSRHAGDRPANYNSSVLPWPVYLQLQNRYPQRYREDDKAWLARVKPLLELERARLMPMSTGGFKDELRSAVLNRGLRQIVKMNDKNAQLALDKRNAGEFVDKKTGKTVQYKPVVSTREPGHEADFEDDMVEWLADMAEVATPADGAIFWNGINENKLAMRVNEWNKTLRPNEVHFGQLEATTDMRHVNGKFVWDYGNAFHKFGEKVSEMLGVGATGHVTAVVRWGLNWTSIFTNTELPRMLQLMAADIRDGKPPRMTDLTIIVIEPLGLLDRVKCYVNGDILQAPIWRVTDTTKTRAATAEECTKLGEVGRWVVTEGLSAGSPIVPPQPSFYKYLMGRPRNPSPATPRLLRDLDDIVWQKIMRT